MNNSTTLLLVVLIACFSISSTNSQELHNQQQIDEVVDIRIFDNGDIKINNNTISESALPSHISALNTSEATRARIIFSENAFTGLIHKTTRLLHENGITQILSKVLSPEEFENYNRTTIHIDIMKSGKILFNGQELYPADLNIALESKEINKDDRVILTISKQTTMGPVTDTEKALVKNGFRNLNLTPLSNFR